MPYPPSPSSVQLNRPTLQAVVVSKTATKREEWGEQVFFYPQTHNRNLSEGQMTNHNEASHKA